MSDQGVRPSTVPLTSAQIKDAADPQYVRIDGANRPPHVFNNALMNPSFDWWQRGNGPFTVSGSFGPDRWRQFFTTTGSIARRVLSIGDAPTQSRLSATFTCSGQAAAGDFYLAQQTIEDCLTFAGKRVLVRGLVALLSGPVGSKIGIELERNYGSGGSAIEQFYAGQVVLTGVLTPFAVWVDLPSVAGKVLGPSDNGNLNLNIFLSAGSNYNARTNNLGLQNIAIQLVDVEVKEIKPGYGDQFPGFERLPKFLDLINCLRYYQTGAFKSGIGGNNGSGAYNAAYIGGTCPLPVLMRISPSVVFFDVVGNLGVVTTGTGNNVGLTAGGVSMLHPGAINVDALLSTGNANNWFYFGFRLTAEL